MFRDISSSDGMGARWNESILQRGNVLTTSLIISFGECPVRWGRAWRFVGSCWSRSGGACLWTPPPERRGTQVCPSLCGCFKGDTHRTAEDCSENQMGYTSHSFENYKASESQKRVTVLNRSWQTTRQGLSVAEAMWSIKPEMFTLWTFIRKLVEPWVRPWTLMPLA